MRYFLGPLAIISAAMLWAIDSAVLRPSLYGLDSFIVVFSEHLIAFIFMFPLLMHEISELKKMRTSDWVTMFLIALFGGVIGTIAITEAFFGVFKYQLSNLSTVVILQKTQPVFAVLLARALLKEKIGRNFMIWFMTAIAGSYLLAFGLDLPRIEYKAFYVPVLAMLASVSFAAGTVLGRKILGRINSRVATYLRFGLTTLITFILISFLGKLHMLSDLTIGNLWILLIIAFTTGGVAIMIYYFGLKRVPASRATIYELGFPVTALILEYVLPVFFHKWFPYMRVPAYGIWNWTGAFLIILSMFMVMRDK